MGTGAAPGEGGVEVTSSSDKGSAGRTSIAGKRPMGVYWASVVFFSIVTNTPSVLRAFDTLRLVMS